MQNPKNLILSVQVEYDDGNSNELFISKSGTAWNIIDNKLHFLDNNSVKSILGLTSKELLNLYSTDCTEYYVREKNCLINLDDDVSSRLMTYSLF